MIRGNWPWRRQPDAALRAPAQHGLPAVRASENGTRRYASDSLRRFLSEFEYGSGRHILNLGPLSGMASQSIGRLGHHAHFVDIVRSCEGASEELVGSSEPTSPLAIERFVRNLLDYPPQSFDGVLAWNVFQQLDTPAMRSTLDQLVRIMRPGCPMHCVFRSGGAVGGPALNCGLASTGEFIVASYPGRMLEREVGIKDLESTFARFSSLCVFLERKGGFLEVLVKS